MGTTLVKLTADEIETGLKDIPEWSEVSEKIQRTFKFDGFQKAIAFVNKIADTAEERQHHPDILIRYDKVSLTLSTHDANGITEKDFDLAKFADSIAAG